ncbi:MAG: XRE family transcriptional regulator [Acidimicrobiales bacterium]|jgi:transcriptional regulator with XRE-family HTH domain|nr:helix-turn-helix domain-containing protein [Actinomycetes bacterium]MDP6104571.1 XRE family transcriptional regulator [Acidimicrobiales bacterium]MCP4844042.1 helix-turn-helix domain-containing protein [Actinomycetes bacterium]MDP6240770.1 XRE family transcriptional regulator [Acidimicrobiales bacterium]MDP6491835.1 XRE family transcriptional regulator [Acidimicrobiales bacterium]|tara:strand:+ start:3169 stop:3777 length:609 start_codon:yes stop_codon:yes gene_type:complete
MARQDQETHQFSSEDVCRVVGERVRDARRALGLTMAQFAEIAEISLGMVSKIEHGQTSPSLSTLTRLAHASEVPITAFFRGLDEEHDVVIVRAGERLEVLHEGTRPGHIYEDLGSLRGPHRIIEPMMVTLESSDDVFPLFQHEGVEFLHMLEGSMDYGYGPKTYRLGAGDTLQIHGEVAHGPTALVDVPVRFMSVKVYASPE